jgi:hypothetical protein
VDRQFDDADRAIHAGAKATRRGYEDIKHWLGGEESGSGHRIGPTRLLAPAEGASYEARGLSPKDIATVNRSLLASAALLSLLAGCKSGNDLDETGGLKITRSTCPAVAVPAYTGDISLFSPEQSQDARALDVTATITNLRTSCDETGAVVKVVTTFDVVARRASASGDRDLVLPYFSTVVRAGTKIMSKQESRVLVHFANGQLRAVGSAQAGAEINKALATLPQIAAERLNRKRKATDADASLDPMNDPRVRAAVNQANFELLVGFQLTEAQLAYNATR